jgi:hypothetical protein
MCPHTITIFFFLGGVVHGAVRWHGVRVYLGHYYGLGLDSAQSGRLLVAGVSVCVLCCSSVAALLQLCCSMYIWDITMDWGLIQRNVCIYIY